MILNKCGSFFKSFLNKKEQFSTIGWLRIGNISLNIKAISILHFHYNLKTISYPRSFVKKILEISIILTRNRCNSSFNFSLKKMLESLNLKKNTITVI